jgi:hypothetical protein
MGAYGAFRGAVKARIYRTLEHFYGVDGML